MTPLNWKRNSDGQFCGACLIAAIVALICLVKVGVYRAYTPVRTVIPFNDAGCRGIVVEMAGETDRRGIYFLPDEHVTIDDLCMSSGLSLRGRVGNDVLHRTLAGGDRVVLGETEPPCSVRTMDNRTMLALGLPIDINRAGTEDLALIPGIGPKTAEAIIALRDERGGLSKREDLKMIRGLGKKRYDGIKRHIFIGKNQ